MSYQVVQLACPMIFGSENDSHGWLGNPTDEEGGGVVPVGLPSHPWEFPF